MIAEHTKCHWTAIAMRSKSALTSDTKAKINVSDVKV